MTQSNAAGLEDSTRPTNPGKHQSMTIDSITVYAVLLGSVFFFGGAAVLALSWAVRDGQFQNFERTARSIFDPDEPIGQITDHFPDRS
jgi:cbb3-type cytochrome oxidase maturation protein